MKKIWLSILKLFVGTQKTPVEYKENFKHYYLDISWYGLLNGSTISFLNYFAVHAGASALQVGIITAAPALVSLLFALPAGVYLSKKSNTKEAFRTSVLTRVFYLVFILLPLFKSAPLQIWSIIVITLIMNIPGIYAQLSFNIAFAENVPDQYRAHVAGLRNAAFAMVTTGITLLCGFVLRYVPFPYGYCIVFAIGFFGSAMSAYELYRIKSFNENIRYDNFDFNLIEKKTRKLFLVFRDWFQSFSRQIRFNLLKGHTGRALVLLWLLNLAIYISAPVFPVYFVNEYHFSDQTISIGMALYYLMMFAGSLGLEKLDTQLGRRKVVSIGMFFMAAFPLFILVSQNALFYFIGNLATGLGWAFTGGEIYNYLLEKIPEADRSSGVAWYNMGANAAILLGSFIGPILSTYFSLAVCLLIFTAARALIGLAIFRWG